MKLPNKTATRELDDDFSRMVVSVDLAGMDVPYLVSVLIPISREVLNWEAIEERADWEQRNGHFVEFNDVKDLLSNLHMPDFYAEYASVLETGGVAEVREFLLSHLGSLCPAFPPDWIWDDGEMARIILEAKRNLRGAT